MARPDAGARTPLSRDRVVEAAVAHADAHGMNTLTMRRLAGLLGVAPMALYRHVEHRDDLVDAMVDTVFAEIGLPPDRRDWRAAMRERAIAIRDVLGRHRWAIGLLESRTSPGPANLRHREAVLAILRGAGFSSAVSATHANNLLDSYIYGFALQEASLPFDGAEELAEVATAIVGQFPVDEYPHLAATAAELIDAGFDYGAEFEYGLDVILDALERTRTAAAD